jgi:hypothetical protein
MKTCARIVAFVLCLVALYSSAQIVNPPVTVTPGSSASTSPFVWYRAGMTLDGAKNNSGSQLCGSSGSCQEPNVLYEGSLEAVTCTGGQGFKMLYTAANAAIMSAESCDGQTAWTNTNSGTAVIAATVGHSGWAKNPFDGKYYVTVANSGGDGTQINIFRSTTSGHGYASYQAAAVTAGAGADANGLDNARLYFTDANNWIMLYDANDAGTYAVFKATSSDAGHTWTKVGGQDTPTVIQAHGCGAGHATTVNGNIYAMAHCPLGGSGVFPSEIFQFSLSADYQTWTLLNPDYSTPSLQIRLPDEGVNLPTRGQVADPAFIQVNGVSHLYYSVYTDTNLGGNSYAIKHAICPGTLVQCLASFTPDAALGAQVIDQSVKRALMVGTATGMPQSQAGGVAVSGANAGFYLMDRGQTAWVTNVDGGQWLRYVSSGVYNFGSYLSSSFVNPFTISPAGVTTALSTSKAKNFQGTTIYSAAGTALPTCNGAAEGTRAVVSDATAPTYLAAYTSGGTVHAPVYCDGTSWKTD